MVDASLSPELLILCREIDVSSSRKAIIVHVPYRLRKSFQKIHSRLVRELEKKFSGKVRSYRFCPLCIV